MFFVMVPYDHCQRASEMFRTFGVDLGFVRQLVERLHLLR